MHHMKFVLNGKILTRKIPIWATQTHQNSHSHNSNLGNLPAHATRTIPTYGNPHLGPFPPRIISCNLYNYISKGVILFYYIIYLDIRDMFQISETPFNQSSIIGIFRYLLVLLALHN